MLFPVLKGRKRAVLSQPAAANVAMLAALKVARAQVARAIGVPASELLPDLVLEGIAVQQPSSRAALGRCPGMDAERLDRYGDLILEVIAAITG
jgi:ATP-dependent DNA helicase RecQ